MFDVDLDMLISLVAVEAQVREFANEVIAYVEVYRSNTFG